ncbi:MAG: hypothetical protein ACJA1Z_001842 [Patiriisocius sp.]|jgi:hypothetical protein
MFTQTIYTGANCEVITLKTAICRMISNNITVSSGSSSTIDQIVILNKPNLSVEFNFSGVLKSIIITRNKGVI